MTWLKRTFGIDKEDDMKTETKLLALLATAVCGALQASNPAITALYTPDPAPVVAATPQACPPSVNLARSSRTLT